MARKGAGSSFFRPIQTLPTFWATRISISGFPDFQNSEFSDVQNSAFPDFPKSGFSDFPKLHTDGLGRTDGRAEGQAGGLREISILEASRNQYSRGT